MPDIETITKADAAFDDLRTTVEVEFEHVAKAAAIVIEKAASDPSDENRDAVRRALAVMKQADSADDDATIATVDEDLWKAVSEDAEGLAVTMAPSRAVESLAKSWSSEPAVAPESIPEPEAAPERSIYSYGDLNDMG